MPCLDGLVFCHFFQKDRCQRDIVHDRQMREQVKLLEHHAHFLPHFIDVDLGRVDQLIVHVDLALRHVLEQVQASQESALAGTGGTDHNDDFSGGDMFVDAV